MHRKAAMGNEMEFVVLSRVRFLCGVVVGISILFTLCLLSGCSFGAGSADGALRRLQRLPLLA